MIPEDDLHWLAGLLEGESSFMESCPSHPNCPRISLMMTDLDIVQRAAGILGVSLHSYPSKKGYKPTHQLALKGKQAVEVMKQLRPLMGARRQAKIDHAIAAYDPHYRSHSRTFLTDEQILEIYRRACLGEPCKRLAQEFGVTYVTVYDVKNGKSWSWLTGHPNPKRSTHDRAEA